MGIFNRGAKVDQAKYEKGVAKRLDEVLKDSKERMIDLSERPIVLVSDLHKGSRDGADDFWRCERAYHTALGYYLEAGYRLYVLGDVEELWECWPGAVLNAYSRTLELESSFYKEERYERLWGNHDDLWRHPDQVAKHLHAENFFPGLEVHEGLKLRLRVGHEDLGTMFLVHGHQGTPDSDHHAKRSQFLVRYFWRPVQRITGKSRNTPAKDYRLRAKHDKAMFKWADAQRGRLVMVAGHTHRPVFAEGTVPSIEDLQAKLAAMKAGGDDSEAIAAVSAQLELLEAERRWRVPAPKPMSPPCYFNTGCCAFSNGTITALELSGHTIRLVQWLDDEGRPRQKQVSAPADLRQVFAEVAGETPVGGANGTVSDATPAGVAP